MLHLQTIASVSLDTTSQESNLSREETADISKDSVIVKLYLRTISQNGLKKVGFMLTKKHLSEESSEAMKISVKK